MTAQVLTTKLHIPPFRPTFVSRPAILESLERGLSRRLTLVCAPAGFGKTTILSEWAQSCQRPFTWISLDEGDNDPHRFFLHLIAALQRIEMDIGDVWIDSLEEPQFPPMESILTGLINEIFEVSKPFVLVLDDYHLITNRILHDALVFLVENIPHQLHLVISGRVDPPWPIARLRARGLMNEIRTRDLRFTTEEVTRFLRDVMVLKLSSQDISALEARTEGWIAGLQMAALSMKGRRDVSSFIQSFTGSHRYIMDYLVEEILQGQSSSIQIFLLKTSILEQMTADLCDVVVGEFQGQTSQDLQHPLSSQEMLEYLEHANLFVVPLDEERNWYRYHHLFSQILQSRLNQVSPSEIPILHQRASHWFENVGQYDQAILHAFSGEDIERAVDLVEKYAMMMITRSELGSLSKWLEQIPKHIIQSRPWLSTFQAWITYWHGPRAEVEGWLEAAEAALLESPEVFHDPDRFDNGQLLSKEENKHIAGQIASIRAYAAIPEGDYELVAQMAEKGLSLLPEGDFAQSVCAIALGIANWGKGNIAASQEAFQKAKNFALMRGNRQQAVTAYCYYGEQQIKLTYLHQALRTFEEALEVARRRSGHLIGSGGFALVKMADLYREWNELDKSEAYLSQSLEVGSHWGIADFIADTYVAGSRLNLTREDMQDAWNILQKADDLEARMKIDPWLHTRLDECRLKFWLASGDLKAVAQWIEDSGLKSDGKLSYLHDLHHLNLARAWVVMGSKLQNERYLNEALHLIHRIQNAADRAQWVHEKMKALILKCLALCALGKMQEAWVELKSALQLAQPGGYVRIFLDEGPPLLNLLKDLQTHSEVGGYATNVLIHLEPEAGKRKQVGSGTVFHDPSSRMVEKLTERELEILRLVKTGMNSTEIAAALTIAVSTVRSHLKNIFSKLDVHSRLEAIQKAEQLQLFQADESIGD